MTSPDAPIPPSASPPPADALEERLRAEAWIEEPGDLAARILLGLPSRRAGFDRRALLRFAAAVVAAFGVWFFATGAVPSLANAAPQPIVERALFDTRAALPGSLTTSLEPWTMAAAPSAEAPPLLVGALGLVVLVGGLWLARRLLRRTPERSAAR